MRSLVRRGRVEVNVGIQADPPRRFAGRSRRGPHIHGSSGRVREALQIDDSLDLKTLLGLPGVISSRELRPPAGAPGNSAVGKAVIQGVEQALAGVIRMRELEGEALRRDLRQQLEGIAHRTQQIRELAPSERLGLPAATLGAAGSNPSARTASIPNDWRRKSPCLQSAATSQRS